MAESLSAKHAPKVSIVSISYNQEAYIAQALEGFVSQKTTFRFEVIIGDDCSTDKTASIIHEYAKKYPDIIKPILRKKNAGVQKNLIDVLQHAKGAYIALCEGDDFWTDISKLQRQADFLDENPEFGLVFHPVRVFFEKQEQVDSVYPAPDQRKDFTVEGLLKRNFIQTNSVMYRRRHYDDTMPLDILPLDWYLHLYHAKGSKIGFINRVMSAYRRHEGGVWWNSDRDFTALWVRHGLAHFRLYDEILKLYGSDKKHEAIIRQHIYNLLMNILKLDSADSHPILERLAAQHSGDLATFVQQMYDAHATETQEKEKQAQKLHGALSDSNARYEAIQKEIVAMRNSKLWKLRKPIGSIKKIVRRK